MMRMRMNLNTDLTPAEAEVLALLLERLSFNQILACTHMGADKEQAYFMQGAAGKVRRALGAEIEASEQVERRIISDPPLDLL